MYPSFFLSRHFVTLISNLVLIFAGGTNDERLDGQLHGPRKLVDRLKERAKTAEMGLHKLEAWREVQIKMLDLTKKALEES